MALSDISGMIAGISIYQAFGFFAASVALIIGHGWYIVSIWRGDTKPALVTWALSLAMTFVAFVIYDDAGAEETKLILVADMIGFFLITLVSWIKNPVKPREERDPHELLVINACLAMYAIHLVAQNSIVSVITLIVAELIALWPTIKKTFHNPKDESLLAWMGTCSANFLNILAVHGIFSARFEMMNIAELVYTVSICVVDGVVLLLILRRGIHFSRKLQKGGL